MADQPNEKTEVAAPVADAQEAPTTETKPTESSVEENAAKTDGENKEDAKPADGKLHFTQTARIAPLSTRLLRLQVACSRGRFPSARSADFRIRADLLALPRTQGDRELREDN